MSNENTIEPKDLRPDDNFKNYPCETCNVQDVEKCIDKKNDGSCNESE